MSDLPLTLWGIHPLVHVAPLTTNPDAEIHVWDGDTGKYTRLSLLTGTKGERRREQRERDHKRAAAQREREKAAGECRLCSEPARPGRVMCLECAASERERVRAQYRIQAAAGSVGT